MKRLKKILRLSDPYPDFGYEISCYVKAVLGTVFFILGFFSFFYPFAFGGLGWGLFETGLTAIGGFPGWNYLFGVAFSFLGIYFFAKIKLVGDLIKILRG